MHINIYKKLEFAVRTKRTAWWSFRSFVYEVVYRWPDPAVRLQEWSVIATCEDHRKAKIVGHALAMKHGYESEFKLDLIC